METDELIQKCRAITLEDEEEDKVSFAGKMKAKGAETVERCLLGNVLIKRVVNKEGLQVTMQQVWRTVREVKIENLGDNIFMFKFALEADKRRVLVGGPWHFDRALIVPIEPKDAVKELGAVVGKVEEVELDENGDRIGKCARARILAKHESGKRKSIQRKESRGICEPRTHEQPSNTQEEIEVELTQEKNDGSNKPIEIGHVVEEGIEQANWVEGIPRQQLDSRRSQKVAVGSTERSESKRKKAGDKKGEIRGEAQVKNVEIVTLTSAQKENLYNTQVISDDEVVEDGPKRTLKKPKTRKWKSQARNYSGKAMNKVGSVTKKRPRNEAGMPSPCIKKLKKGSPRKEAITINYFHSHVAKFKLSLEPKTMEEMEIAKPSTKDLSAEAGCQPRRQP
ncbi:hypothetical protein WN944_019228 [Citrus x changshan-huyou]|uniref:DUF4283 domain-containing protein n=1 Tax=Citrus x changshan-huyou TaxID=2935761 RepID=A0AAP0M190_9ROSI